MISVRQVDATDPKVAALLTFLQLSALGGDEPCDVSDGFWWLGWNWLISDTYKNPPSANSLISCGYRTFAPSRPWGFDGAIYWRKKIR
jgi:hypothetical protein